MIEKLNKRINELCYSFEMLSACTTKANKIATLTLYSTNKDFCKTIEYLLNEDKISGLRKSKINKSISQTAASKLANIDYYDLNLLLDHLVEHNTGSDQEIFTTKRFLDKISDKTNRQMISDIITKDYKCGVTDSTAFGIIPGLKRNWKERKGHGLTNNKTGQMDLSKIMNKEIMVTLKLDGYRYKLYKNENEIIFYSSSGKQVEGLQDLIDYAKEIKLPNGLYDGECIAIGEFVDSTERFNATTKILRKDGIKSGVEFIAFDYLNLEDAQKFFDFVKIKKVRKDRYEDLLNIQLDSNGLIKPVECFMKHAVVTDEVVDEIMSIYRQAVDKGEEGLVIDIADAGYERKKSNSMFKLKPELTGDFKVVDMVEGKGKDKGRLGAFIIEYKNNTVNVGSGLTDAIRDEVWQDKDKYLNKLIEVTYFGETQDEHGEYSLRLPRFKRFRHDKTDVSYN